MVESPSSNESPVAPGDVLAGKYVVERVLGVGGMGVVVAARHQDLGSRVAIKFVLPNAVNNPEVMSRFLREAQAATRITSEHVARVTDVGRLDSSAPYMVMEYLDGCDLGQVLEQQGPFAITVAIDYVMQAMVAIAEAHSLGIVHRDLKPSNLFLTHRADGSALVKVLDFGISKATALDSQVALTRTGGMMGTPVYMSPEQVRNTKQVDPRSDIWSLGVILFELLGGRPPFHGETVGAVLAATLTDTPLSLRELRPEVPAALEKVVRRCLEKTTDKRWSNIGELASALAPFGGPEADVAKLRVTGITSRTLGPPVVSVVEQRPAAARTQAPWTTTAGKSAARPLHPRKPIFVAAISSMAVLILVGVAVVWHLHSTQAEPASSVMVAAPPAESSSPTTATSATEPAPDLSSSQTAPIAANGSASVAPAPASASNQATGSPSVAAVPASVAAKAMGPDKPSTQMAKKGGNGDVGATKGTNIRDLIGNKRK